jgi:hypothetical protein
VPPAPPDSSLRFGMTRAVVRRRETTLLAPLEWKRTARLRSWKSKTGLGLGFGRGLGWLRAHVASHDDACRGEEPSALPRQELEPRGTAISRSSPTKPAPSQVAGADSDPCPHPVSASRFAGRRKHPSPAGRGPRIACCHRGNSLCLQAPYPAAGTVLTSQRAVHPEGKESM